MKKYILVVICGLLVINISQGQILKNIGEKVSKKVEDRANRKIDKTIDDTLDKVMEPELAKAKSKSPDSETNQVPVIRTDNVEAATKQTQSEQIERKENDRFDGPNCKKAELAKLPGKWRENPMGSATDVPEKYVKKEREVIAKFRQMFMQNYKPVGLVVSNSDVVGLDRTNYYEETAKNWATLPYRLSVFFLEYYCDNRTDTPVLDGSGIETGTRLEISANNMYQAFSLEPHIVKTSKLPLDPWVATNYQEYEMDGYIKWDLNTSYKNDPKRMAEMWIITNDGKKPYSFVTKKEYLERMKVILKDRLEEDKKTAYLMNPVRSKAEQDANKQSSIERWKKSGESEGKINHWISEWQTDEEKLAAHLKLINDEYTKNINNIDNYLKKTGAGDLGSPATPIGNEAGMEFSNFDSGPNSFRVLKLNESYYNRNLPLSSPQFITVYISNSAQDNPTYYKAIEDTKKAIDVKFLKSLLEK